MGMRRAGDLAKTVPVGAGRAAANRAILLLAGSIVLLASSGCSALGPGVIGIGAAAHATPSRISWAVVDISKPMPTPAPPTPTSTIEPTVEPTIQPTAEPPLPSPSPTPDAGSLITMVIVGEDISPSQGEVAPAPTDPNGKSILVSISEQHLYAYENGQLIFSFVSSTGMGNSTRIGSFNILDKIPSAYGANWDIWMPNWMGIYWSGTLENGIHALPILPNGAQLWAGYLGRPVSYGCVVLGVDEAMQLYNWADVGTPVEIVY